MVPLPRRGLSRGLGGGVDRHIVVYRWGWAGTEPVTSWLPWALGGGRNPSRRALSRGLGEGRHPSPTSVTSVPIAGVGLGTAPVTTGLYRGFSGGWGPSRWDLSRGWTRGGPLRRVLSWELGEGRRSVTSVSIVGLNEGWSPSRRCLSSGFGGGRFPSHRGISRGLDGDDVGHVGVYRVGGRGTIRHVWGLSWVGWGGGVRHMGRELSRGLVAGVGERYPSGRGHG